MSRNALILFVTFFVILYVSSPPRGIYAEAASLTNTQNSAISVLDAMTADKELCASGKPFSESGYAKVCKDFEYPKGDVTFKSSNSQQFMCLGLYDRIYRLCHLDTLKVLKKSLLPENAAQFDQQVTASFPESGEAIFQFCKTWKHDYPPKYDKTMRFSTQLEKAIREPALCVKHCTADDASVVALCVVLATMDNMSKPIAQGAQSLEATSQKKAADHAQVIPSQTGQLQTAVEHDSKGAAAVSQKLDDPTAHVKTSGAAAQSLKTTETENMEGSSDKHVATSSQALPAAPITDLKSQQETSHASSATQAEKIGKDAQVTGAHTGENGGASETEIKETEKENDEITDKAAISGSEKTLKASEGLKVIGSAPDGAAPAKPADGAALDKPADGSALAKPADGAALAKPADGAAIAQSDAGAALPPSGDGAALGQQEGISGEDISGEDLGGILDDAKLGSISQHTQDEPETQFGGADGIDPAAVEPPALVDEESDQSVVQPSDKREYVPHLPSPNEDDSHFFGYFTVIGVMCIAGYVGYHNKQKILAMVLEGRRSRGGRSRRRPSTANYRKLDCTLEEAVTSQCSSNVTHVIY